MTILVLIGTVFLIIWVIFLGRISLTQCFCCYYWICEWVQVGIGVYIKNILENIIQNVENISLRKCRVKSHSSPWFSAACAAAIVYRNHFFHLCQKDKFSDFTGRLVIIAKAFWKLLTLHMLIKQKSPLLPRNLPVRTFGELVIVFSTKVNLLYLLYSMARRGCLLHLIKQNCLLKTFVRTLILMTLVSLYLFSLAELIWDSIAFL